MTALVIRVRHSPSRVLIVVVPSTDLPVVRVVDLASQCVDGLAFVELGVDPAVFFVVEVPQDRDGFDDPAVLLDGLGESVLTR